jgi:Fe-S cluster assembly ATP-binding protein
VTQGSVKLMGEELLELDPEERSLLGLFMSFQYPVEVAGVTNRQFLQAILRARGEEGQFEQKLQGAMELMEVRPDLVERGLNEGFSGGEKKRNEMLQMALLAPKMAVLDETDSGLDIDALRAVARGVKRFASPERSLLLITHYQRLLELVEPDVVHVMIDGQIVRSGGPDVALEVEAHGYAR